MLDAGVCALNGCGSTQNSSKDISAHTRVKIANGYLLKFSIWHLLFSIRDGARSTLNLLRAIRTGRQRSVFAVTIYCDNCDYQYTMNKSQRYPPEVEDMRRELQSLSRKDLQTLAKQEGVKANMSSAAIIEELLRFASDAPGRP